MRKSVLDERSYSNAPKAKTDDTLIKRINWFHVFWLLIVPLLGFVSATQTPLYPLTLAWSLVYYFITALGITAGYHRLWAHRSYTASTPLKIYLALSGAGTLEDSIRVWSADHRAHHRYTDTTKDPYSVRKGLLYSHIGWLVMKQDPEVRGRVDISDLDTDPVVIWQHTYYRELALLMGFIFPTLISGVFWSDYTGGLVYAGILRCFCVQQATFCVNSLAHWLGDATFSDKISPRDHVFTALVSMGEGYHNFHHEFPADYRNAIAWHQYDPTKWFIWCCKKLGLAGNLKQFRRNEIEKGRLQQEQKRLDQQQNALNEKKGQLVWPVRLEDLPVVEWEEYEEQAKDQTLVAVAGVVHDVGDFVRQHPGGEALIKSGIGKDATAMFNGGVYNHSNAAHNLLSTMRIAVIRGGCEVEIWKRADEKASISEST